MSCGVHEAPDALPHLDPHDDFGPSSMTPSRDAGSDLDSRVDASTSESMLPARTDAGKPDDTSKQKDASKTPENQRAMEKADAGMMAAAASGAHTMTGTAGASATPARVTIQLGNETVAKEDVIAFIHIGHSNMAGRGGAPTELRPYFFDETDPHAWMYHAGTPPQLAKEPFTAGDDSALRYTLGGPGIALLKQAVEMAPNKHFVSLGYANSNAWCSQFLPGGLYYDAMMAAPRAIKDRATFAAIIVMLGNTEHDGGSGEVPRFAQCINSVVTAIRADLSQPDLPVLLCDYEREATGDYAVGGEVANNIIPEIAKVPGIVHNSAIVPTEGVTMQDNHHFDLNGHKVWSRRALDLMKQKGWFPWAQ